MNIYRFSIAWSRILPSGDTKNINEAGVEYYNRVINKTLEHGLEPMVTMYHFDMPQALQRFGGFVNSVLTKYFEDYADLLFKRYGDRVKYWITFNEPFIFCLYGYGKNNHPPAINAHGFGEYLCAHNVLKAHALAYRLNRKKYYSRFKSQIGIALPTKFYYSKTNNTVDVEKAMQFGVISIYQILL